MTDLLFDPPWYLLIGLLLAGLFLVYNGLTRQAANLKWAGVAALIAGIALYVAGRVFETGIERVSRETRELVQAADQRDWKTFSRLLDPSVRFAIYAGRDQLTAGAAKTMDQVGVKNVTVGNMEVKPEPGGYTVSFTATADIEVTSRRAPTDWKFFWAKDRAGDGYLVYRVEPLPNRQFGTEPVLSRLATP